VFRGLHLAVATAQLCRILEYERDMKRLRAAIKGER
jgi:hypothetical protein